MGMIEELLKEKYKLRIPPTVYYDLLADVQEAEKEQEPTTKNDLVVDCIVDVLGSYTDLDIPYKREIAENILANLPSVTPQEPRCKDCKWWKDSDGKYRRGCGAESPCPINTHTVCCGEGYCYMFEPQENEDKE